MTARPRVFLDSETDRLPPDHRPWEIAVLKERDGHLDETVIVVTDIDLWHADPKSLAMNGFHDRHPQGDRFTEYAPGVLYLTEDNAAAALDLLLKDAEIVAAQPAFDTECIAAMLRRHGLEPNWHHRLRDCESQVEGFLGRSVGGLQDCAKQLGIPVDPLAVHSALGDARLVHAIWEHIFRREIGAAVDEAQSVRGSGGQVGNG